MFVRQFLSFFSFLILLEMTDLEQIVEAGILQISIFFLLLVDQINPCSILSSFSLDLVFIFLNSQRFGILEQIRVLLVLNCVVQEVELVNQGERHRFIIDLLAFSSVLLDDVFFNPFLHPVEVELSCCLSGVEAVFPSQPPVRRPALRYRDAVDSMTGQQRSSPLSVASTYRRSKICKTGIPVRVIELIQNPFDFMKFFQSDLFGTLSRKSCCRQFVNQRLSEAVAAPGRLAGGGAKHVGSLCGGGHVGIVSKLRVHGPNCNFLSDVVLVAKMGCIMSVESLYSTVVSSMMYVHFW